MKQLLIVVMSFTIVTVFAQTDQEKINQQVWIPFTKAFIDRDPEAFMAVHSRDLIRAERDGKTVLGYEAYKNGMLANWPKWSDYLKKNNIQHTFELRFIERHSNGEQAFEVGYFKNESVNSDGEKRVSYGQFHVALRKENGTWKILVDSDSNNGGTITDEMFAAAEPIK